jgi:hypothetical protein
MGVYASIDSDDELAKINIDPFGGMTRPDSLCKFSSAPPVVMADNIVRTSFV